MSSALLIDYDKIIAKTKFANISPPSQKDTGLVLIVPQNQVNHLESLPKGLPRVKYLNSPVFVKQIAFHCYVLYNPNKKICILPECACKHLQPILKSLETLDQDTTLLITLSDDNSQGIEECVRNGFDHPYISPDNKLVLTKMNGKVKKGDTNTMNQIHHVISQRHKSHCDLTVQFTPQAIAFLKKASKIGITTENGKKSQKELTGELIVQSIQIKSNNQNFIYMIGLDESSVRSGKEEDVDVDAVRYNFHSHPEEAYVRHSVNKAWPSSTDYLGVLYLGKNTVFHCVATLEGIYVVSLTPYWGNKPKKVSKDFVIKNYGIDHKEHYTPSEYVKKINAIKYKGHPIYHVQYLDWNRVRNPFTIHFTKIDQTCLTTQDGFELYNKLKQDGTHSPRHSEQCGV